MKHIWLCVLLFRVVLPADPHDDMAVFCNDACVNFYDAKDRCLEERDCYNYYGGEFNALVWACRRPCLEIPEACEFSCFSNYFSIITQCCRQCNKADRCVKTCFQREFDKVKPLLEY